MIFYEDTIIEDVLKTFEEYYVKKEYSKALLVLEKQGQDLPKSVFHYNLGTIHAEMENLGLSRFHFLQAREVGLSRPELARSLKAVEERLDIEKLERPLNASDHFVRGSLFAKEGALTFLCLIVLLAGLLILRKGATFSKVLIWAVMVILPLALSLWIDTWSLMIAVKPGPISEGPSAIFKEAGELPEGVMVIARGKGEWKEITYPSRFAGWARAGDLKELE